MKKFIITTTINEPTEATRKFCKIAAERDWTFVIVGDTKTPHDSYRQLTNVYSTNVIYLDPDTQDQMFPELSKIIGWKSIQRRNIGFVYAHKNGANIVATVDDDNIPYENWGIDLLIGKTVEVDCFVNTVVDFFDPLSPTNHNDLWHRGYPIECLPAKNFIEYKGKIKRKVLVQADFWDGDPDIDAICRLSKKPIVKFNQFDPFCSTQLAPFNSQNTFLASEVLPYYAVLPHCGRMDDIWGSYLLQKHFPNSVVYNKATVYQDRNIQDLIVNLEKEIIGYKNTHKMLCDIDNFENNLPDQAKEFWTIYKNSFK